MSKINHRRKHWIVKLHVHKANKLTTKVQTPDSIYNRKKEKRTWANEVDTNEDF